MTANGSFTTAAALTEALALSPAGTGSDPISFAPVQQALRLRLHDLPADLSGPVSVTTLSLDGVSRLGDIVAQSPDLVSGTQFPRSVANGGVLARVAAQSLRPGDRYLLQYTITGQSAGAYPFIAAGSPFPNSQNPLPSGPGSHAQLIEVEDGFAGTGTVELIRASGQITVGSVSLYKADWTLDLSSAREWAASVDPGHLTGQAAAPVMALVPGGTLVPGETFELRYEILAARNVTSFFVPDRDSPFDYQDLPRTVGRHRVTLRVDTDTAARDILFRLSGEFTFGFVSLRRTGEGRAVAVEIAVGEARYSAQAMAPLPGLWHVAGGGSDVTGTGAPEAPFRTPAHALAFCSAAETLYLRAGSFPAFVATVPGHSEAERFQITTLPGEEHLPVIIGHDLVTARASGNYYGVHVAEVDFVEVSNLTVQDTKKEGILLRGQEPALDQGPPPIYGGHLVAGNLIRRTGSSGIMVCGFYPDKRLGIGNAATEVVRIENVLIRRNDVSETNVVNDYNQDFTNVDGNPGGANEAITVCCAYRNVVSEWNDVHDTLQYGIDYKGGGTGGAIRFNRIWNCVNHGIYIDSDRRFVEDLDIHDNLIWGCRNGLVLAREADYDGANPPADLSDFQMRLRNIRIWNNVIFDMERYGMLFYAHPLDCPSGRIENISVRFNTVVNCGQDQEYRDEIRMVDWSNPDWLAASVVSGFEMIGNLVWRNTGAVKVTDDFGAVPGFTVLGNANFTTPQDPLFLDPERPVSLGAGVLPEITLPDYRLSAASPVRAWLAGYSEAPFQYDAAGQWRPTRADAGALQHVE